MRLNIIRCGCHSAASSSSTTSSSLRSVVRSDRSSTNGFSKGFTVALVLTGFGVTVANSTSGSLVDSFIFSLTLTVQLVHTTGSSQRPFKTHSFENQLFSYLKHSRARFRRSRTGSRSFEIDSGRDSENFKATVRVKATSISHPVDKSPRSFFNKCSTGTLLPFTVAALARDDEK